MTPTAETVIRTATDDEIASVEEQLRLLFVRVRAVWKEAAAAVHPDLQPVGYKIISAIVHRGRMHAGALADELEIDKSVREPPGASTSRRSGSPVTVADPNDGRARVHRGHAGRDRERRPEGLPHAAAALRGAAHLVGRRRRRARATARPADVRGRGSGHDGLSVRRLTAPPRLRRPAPPHDRPAIDGSRAPSRLRRLHPCRGAPATGSRTVNRVAPGSLVTDTSPWCASTTARTIASPSPVLPARRDRDESPRANRSNSEPTSSGGMPGPSSSTASTTSSPSRSSMATTLVPSGVCTRAFASRFVTTWRSRGSSPVTTVAASGQPHLPVVVGPGRLRVADGLDDDAAEVDRTGGELAALVEAGEQQQVLDELGHAHRLRLDAADRVHHVGRQLAAVQAGELGVAADRGERRAQLVAGVGDEAAHLLLALLASRQGGCHVTEHAVERGAEPADLGALVVDRAPARRARRRRGRAAARRRAARSR